MSLMHGMLRFLGLSFSIFLAACSGAGTYSQLHYPMIQSTELNMGSADCGGLDHTLRQVDSIRWSMREDGAELETEFEQVVQLSIATAAAIAIAVPLASVAYPEPTLIALPYALAYSAPDNLKRADALLIALLAKREELQCPAHYECAMQNGHSDTLLNLRTVREQVEANEMPEVEGIQKLTRLLDNLCPVGKRYLGSV